MSPDPDSPQNGGKFGCGSDAASFPGFPTAPGGSRVSSQVVYSPATLPLPIPALTFPYLRICIECLHVNQKSGAFNSESLSRLLHNRHSTGQGFRVLLRALQMEATRFACEGLPVGEVNVSEIREEVPESMICSYFGKKSSKSGWKYNVRPTLVEQEAIRNLYCRVYGTDEIPNKEISVSFARGLILMSMGWSVNWKQFSEERQKVRDSLKKRAEERKQKREREADDGVLTAPSTLGKKRFSADRVGSVGFPTTLSLTVKSEGEVDAGLLMGKKGSSRVGRNGVLPGWSSGEVESMERAIESTENLLKQYRLSMVESVLALGSVEDSLRRAKLLRSDRELIAAESKVKSDHFSELERASRVKMESRSLRLVEVQLRSDPSSREECVVLQQEVDASIAELEDLSFQKGLEENTIRLSGEAVARCEGNIAKLEVTFTECSAKKDLLEGRVTSLENALSSMAEQLRRMQMGVGASFFPIPLERSPEFPIAVIHTLNACPVCSLWFSCWDYSSLACGHTYHPYCLYEHSQKSSQCLVPLCKKTFDPLSCAAIGIRPTTVAVAVKKPVAALAQQDRVVAANSTDGGRTTTSPTSSCWRESPEKITPLSQSSQTDVTSKQCFAEPVQKTTPTALCEVCRIKEVSVFLKGCGHDVFCFSCIQQINVCPVCDGRVTGWGRINSQSKPSLLLDLSTDEIEGNVTESVVAPQTPATDKVVGPTEEEREDASDASGEDLSSGSDTDNGLVHWCGPDEFNNGGTISRQHVPEVEEDQSEGEFDVPAATPKPRSGTRFSAVSTLLGTGPPDVEMESSRGGRKRRRSKHPSASHIQKFKKIVEMAAEDILGPVPRVDASGAAGASDIEPAPMTKKRPVGRPPSASKTAGQKPPKEAAPATKTPLEKVQQLRSTLRRREVQDTVPVKFRGL